MGVATLLTCSLGLTACVTTDFLRRDTTPSKQNASTSTTADMPAVANSPQLRALKDDAAYAWQLGNMERAENLYKQLSLNPNMGSTEKSLVWQRLALAAQYNNRPNTAFEALNAWQKLSPEAETSPLWQDAWLSSISKLGVGAGQRAAQELWQQQGRSEQARALAAMVLMGRGWSATQSMQAVPLVRVHYAQQDLLRKQGLERMMAKEVQRMPDVQLLALNQKIVESKDFTFPANITLLEGARRGLGLSAELLAKVQDPAQYADKNIVQNILRGGDVGPVSLTESSLPSLSQQP